MTERADDAEPQEPTRLPHFPTVHGRLTRRVLTKQVLKLRARELDGRGFGFRYYAPRVLLAAGVLLVIGGVVVAVVAARVEGMAADALLYPVRRTLEDAALFTPSVSGADGLHWRAARRIADARRTAGATERRSLLREFESDLDAAEAQLASMDTDAQMRIRIHARDLEEQAVLLVRSWALEEPPAAPGSPGSTWVIDAEHDLPLPMQGDHSVTLGSGASGDPLDTMPISALLRAEQGFSPAMRPVLARLRALVYDGVPYVPARDVERYARFLLTD